MSRRADARLVALSLLLLGLVGCARGIDSTPAGAPNLRAWVAEVRARPASALEPLPVMQQFETFEYSAQGMRDPFTDVWVNPGGGNGTRPDPDRRKQPLEAFALGSLDMVGTIGAGRGLVALVMAPDGVTYRVRPGVYLGQSDGRVTGVFDDRIELVELVTDGAGGWLERPVVLALEDE